jgi:parallel beta-helix repeat protein
MGIFVSLVIFCTSSAGIGKMIYVDDDATGGDIRIPQTATARLFEDTYDSGQQVPIEISITNSTQRPAYVFVDESGFIKTYVRVEDANGTAISVPIASPPPPPRHYYIEIDGRKVLTVPVKQIEPGQTVSLFIQDALESYHEYLEEGTYYLKPSDITVIHQAGLIITRDDVSHPRWIAPSTVVSRSRHSVNAVEIYLQQKTIIYVDADATGANDGSSWADAYIYLQEALADANAAEKPVEIRVAQGIYKPNEGLVAIPEFDWRMMTFQLINGVDLKGGYAGVDAPDPNERDIELYETILSGDLNGDDAEVADSSNLVTEPTRAENSYHVVFAFECNESPILDGFTISGGNAYNPNDELSIFNGGGGIYITMSNPLIYNCIFINNSAYINGGGIINCQDSNSVLNNCTFYGNSAVKNGGGISIERNSDPTLISCNFYLNSAEFGGGMSNENSNPILTNCQFSKNSADDDGGGIFNGLESNPTLANCTFRENFSVQDGGGMMNRERSNPAVTNCRFSGNRSDSNGGGISNTDSNPAVTNCILTGNTANLSGGGIYNDFSSPIIINCTFSGNRAGGWGGGIIQLFGRATMTNCILWGDTPSEIMTIEPISEGSILPTYSNIQGGFPGEGNLDIDPYFANPGYWADADDPNTAGDPNDPNSIWVDGDYHLKSEVGRWGPNSESWVYDDVTSPCIDAGDPNSDWSQEVWPHGERVNMGAYGGTEQASMSAGPQPLFLPNVAYIFEDEIRDTQSFEFLLETYGCSVTLISLADVTQTAFDSYDVIIIGNDTGTASTWWGEDESIPAIENAGKPIVGLGEGGYAFFGKLGLFIGYPNGGAGEDTGMCAAEPGHLLFSVPYTIGIPDDGVLLLYGETRTIKIWLDSVPENLIVPGEDAADSFYSPLILEGDRYLLWGFINSPEDMTETGKKLFINSVILTANVAWETAVGE